MGRGSLSRVRMDGINLHRPVWHLIEGEGGSSCFGLYHSNEVSVYSEKETQGNIKWNVAI